MPTRAILLLALAATGWAEHHVLPSTPKTVHWGYYAAALAPVLRIHSGDTVEIRTGMIDSPEALERAGVPSAQIEASHRAIHSQVKERGPGPHILTGPIYVEGAEPGDTLEVRIESVTLALPYAVNLFLPGFGALPEDFPYQYRKIIPLDKDRMVAHFAPGIDIPLRPFFGSMGVAPPDGLGRINSAPPWIHAGNLDNKELAAGATLYIPVHTRGALFSVGDAHAGQGNGEVSLTALETVLTGLFRFTVRKDRPVRWPFAETPTHYMSMGFDENLDLAMKIALREMIDFLAARFNLSRQDAYLLVSDAADFSITQVVDGKRGVHAMIPKSIFTRREPVR
ncbi:MAG: acetamidase/formamidase family protein [Candidatus Solibacter usitatus]|nr:acetamidase/formamidase family protein [Candidatus Solibacter usitatus]